MIILCMHDCLADEAIDAALLARVLSQPAAAAARVVEQQHTLDNRFAGRFATTARWSLEPGAAPLVVPADRGGGAPGDPPILGTGGLLMRLSGSTTVYVSVHGGDHPLSFEERGCEKYLFEAAMSAPATAPRPDAAAPICDRVLHLAAQLRAALNDRDLTRVLIGPKLVFVELFACCGEGFAEIEVSGEALHVHLPLQAWAWLPEDAPARASARAHAPAVLVNVITRSIAPGFEGLGFTRTSGGDEGAFHEYSGKLVVGGTWSRPVDSDAEAIDLALELCERDVWEEFEI
jgi:hypothetical protein